MDLTQLWGLASIPLIIGLIEVFKQFVADKRFYPLFAVVLGILINVGIAYGIGESFILAAFMGTIAGLASCGLYSTGSTLAKGESAKTPPA